MVMFKRTRINRQKREAVKLRSAKKVETKAGGEFELNEVARMIESKRKHQLVRASFIAREVVKESPLSAPEEPEDRLDENSLRRQSGSSEESQMTGVIASIQADEQEETKRG